MPIPEQYSPAVPDRHALPVQGGEAAGAPPATNYLDQMPTATESTAAAVSQAEPVQAAPSVEFGGSSRMSRLRQAASYIATRLRLGRTHSSETVATADELYDIGVDEFGFPKSLAAAEPLSAQAGDRYTIPSQRTGEYVKRAPRFPEQVADTSRTNLIEYVTNAGIAVGTQTHERETAEVTEHDTLVALGDFWREAADYTNAEGEHSLAPLAESMAENVTFIGEREYNEAVAAIAENWRQRLNSSETKQLCISAAIAEGDDSTVKSSAYLLDNIIKHFSNDELNAWKGRLVTDPAALAAEPQEASIILLDDWTISGAQLKHSARTIIDEYPEYRKQIEVQLVAASEDRVQDGLKLDDEYSRGGPIPVNAYFAAHAAGEGMADYSGAHITGAHCAVDYDFNDLMSSMAITMGKDMPPGTNIVRPYRKPGYVPTQLQRLRSSLV